MSSSSLIEVPRAVLVLTLSYAFISDLGAGERSASPTHSPNSKMGHAVGCLEGQEAWETDSGPLEHYSVPDSAHMAFG